MTLALRSPVLNRDQCLDGYLDLLHRLRVDLAVAVEHHPMPRNEVGRFDPVTGTARVRADAPLEDQVWLLTELWKLLSIGPWAAGAARPLPLLQLLPAPRTGA